jgi:hypothetical protein
VAEQLAASQEGISSVELVYIIKTIVTDEELLFLFDISAYRRGGYYYSMRVFWDVTPYSFVDISPTTKLPIFISQNTVVFINIAFSYWVQFSSARPASLSYNCNVFFSLSWQIN